MAISVHCRALSNLAQENISSVCSEYRCNLTPSSPIHCLIAPLRALKYWSRFSGRHKCIETRGELDSVGPAHARRDVHHDWHQLKAG